MKKEYRKWLFLTFSILIWYWALVYMYTSTCEIIDMSIVVFLSPILIFCHLIVILWNKSKLSAKVQFTYLLSLIVLFWITRTTGKSIIGTLVSDVGVGMVCYYSDEMLAGKAVFEIIYIPLIFFVAFTLIVVFLRWTWDK